VPYTKNPFFTNREAELAHLREAFTAGDDGGLMLQALSGLGGVGKTQVAVAYALQHKNTYRAVFWLRAETEVELTRSFVEVARSLSLPQAGDPEPRKAVEAVLEWLCAHDGWLLIFDNADDPELLDRRYLPERPGGHVLITSRVRTFDRLGIPETMVLDVLSPDEARKFLLRRTKRKDVEGTEQEAVGELILLLGSLPLALEQAGAFMRETEMSFAEYLASYQTLRVKLLDKSVVLVGDYKKSITTTWALNLQEARRQSPASTELLAACAFLSPDTIPRELFALGAEELGPDLASALAGMKANPVLFDQLLRPLVRYSLIRRNTKTGTYSIHRLLQEVQRQELGHDQEHVWAERVVKALSRAFPPFVDYPSWPLCSLLLPHAQAAARLIAKEGFNTPEAGRLLNQAGYYLMDRAGYAEAEPLLRQALAVREQALGKAHADYGQTLHNLALLYDRLARHDEAEPLYGEALAIREQALGPDHPDVATTLASLAALLDDRGRYAEAEGYFERAIAIRERANDYFRLAVSLSCMAVLRDHQGRAAEAGMLFQRALETWKRAPERDHPSLASSLNNLAIHLVRQKRFTEAEPLYLRALEIWRKTLDADHPRMAACLNNLAVLYGHMKRYREAESLAEQARAIYQRLFGAEHPYIAASLDTLATLRTGQGRWKEAEKLYQVVLPMVEKLLGPDHRHTADVLENYAALLRQLGRTGEAKTLSARARRIRSRGSAGRDASTALARQGEKVSGTRGRNKGRAL
jgi:tetratricopeptide (TPR) repeat protein